MGSELTIGWVQLTSSDHPQDNVASILQRLKPFESENVDAIFLPENCLYQRIHKSSPFFELKGAEDPLLDALKEWSVKFGVDLVLGGVATHRNGVNPVNSIWWLSSSGKAHEVYSKIHLFDVEVEGEPPVRESDYFSAGNHPTMVKYKGHSFGQSICYDVRFPEIYRTYFDSGVDVLLVPASFLPKTGGAHWLTLLKARAIENECFVIAPAQGGIHQGADGGHRKSWGQSVVVDPWGAVLSQGPNLNEIEAGQNGAEWGVVPLDFAKQKEIRRQLPVGQHKKEPSIYLDFKSVDL